MYLIEGIIDGKVHIVDTFDGVREIFDREDVYNMLSLGIPIWNSNYLEEDTNRRTKLAKLTLLAGKDFDIQGGSYGEILCETKLNNARLPNGVESVRYVKYNSQELTTIYIPDGVDCINVALASCHNLKSIRFPRNKTYIRQLTLFNCGVESLDLSSLCGTLSSMYGCKNLTSVKLGDGIDILGGASGHPYLFQDCPLDELVIPSSVKLLQHMDLCSCKFDTLYCPPSVERVKNIHINKPLLVRRGTVLDISYQYLGLVRYYEKEV